MSVGKAKALTLNLSAAECDALAGMAHEAEMSKTGVIRQALRLRHLVRARELDGYELAWRNKETGVVTTMMIELPPMTRELTPARRAKK